MKPVTIYEAKTHLSKLLARVAQGEEVVVKKGSIPIARIVPYTDVPRKRPKVGTVTSRPIRWTADCFQPLSDDEAEAWGL
jgi:prevent-host-death family protein